MKKEESIANETNLPILNSSFNIITNLSALSQFYGFLCLVLSIIILVGTINIIDSNGAFIFAPLLFGIPILFDKMVRPKLSDIPKDQDVISRLELSYDTITFHNKEIHFDEIEECILFYKGYKLEQYKKGHRLTGNAAIYIKESNQNVSVIKYNIPSKQNLKELKNWSNNTEKRIDYFKTYHLEDFTHILNDKGNARREFNKVGAFK